MLPSSLSFEYVACCLSRAFLSQDLNPRKLVAALDLANSSINFDPSKLDGMGPRGGLEAVPTELAIHASESVVERGTVSWLELQEAVGPALAERIWKASQRYGYSDLEKPAPTTGDFRDQTRHEERQAAKARRGVGAA